MPQIRVSDTIMHVTLNTINGVVFYLSGKNVYWGAGDLGALMGGLQHVNKHHIIYLFLT